MDRGGDHLRGDNLQKVKDGIQRYAGNALEVYLWPESASDIPDNKRILNWPFLLPSFPTIQTCLPRLRHPKAERRKLVSELFEKAGTGFRVYKNTLFI